ncbi:hypothetical protein [Vibrio sp. 10N.261.46.A3]|uniref:hypothetical protein n=1 Tax=Vibrio sp. 10N.261.46.A3 TaxID=3229658 RepID=UPI00354F9D1A
MKQVDLLCVKPPFYKGLNTTELGLVTLVGTLIMGSVGIPVALITGWGIVAFSALFLGVISPVILPKRLLSALAKRKEQHCRFYFAQKWHHFFHPEHYTLRSEKMARKRVHHD